MVQLILEKPVKRMRVFEKRYVALYARSEKLSFHWLAVGLGDEASCVLFSVWP